MFIQNIEKNAIDSAVVKSICEIGSLMNKKITAEFVESEEALQILRQFDITFVQGNYLCAPLPLSLAVLGSQGNVSDEQLVL